MRTVTQKIAAATSGPVHTPGYLVELQFSTTIRLCNRGTVIFDGHQWFQGGVEVRGIATGEGGGKSCTITIPNNQFAFSTIVLAETASGKQVRVWKLFGDPPYTDEDAVLIFTGLIDDVPELVNQVTFNCSTQNLRVTSIPNVTIGTPFFNHLPRAGQSITWGGEIYDLEPR